MFVLFEPDKSADPPINSSSLGERNSKTFCEAFRVATFPSSAYLQNKNYQALKTGHPATHFFGAYLKARIFP